MRRLNRTLIICALVIGGVGFWYTNQLFAASWYADELANARAYERVVIGNSTYVVDRGSVTQGGTPVPWRQSFRVLSLAYEKALVERSPLLALPGVQPDKLISAVALLKEQQEYLALSQKDGGEEDLVRTSLYPIRFLESAASLEQARHTFIESGAQADAAHYRSLLKSTLHTYAHDLKQFRSAFQTVVPSNAPAYGTDTYIIDYPGMMGALAMLEKGAGNMRRSLLMRTLCTRGIIVACNPDDIRLPEIQNRDKEVRTGVDVTQDVTALYRAAGFKLSEEPSVTLTTSSCIPDNTPATFSFLRYSNPASEHYFAPLFTGDILFIRSALYTSSPFYQYFHDNGIGYVPVDPLTYYECPESARDFASTLAILEIIRFAKAYDVSLYLTDSEASHVQMLRKRLLGTMVHERDATEYISTLRTILPSTEETEPLHQALDALSLSLSYKAAGLTELISTIVQFEKGNRVIAGRGVAFDVTAKNLFYIRSGFGSLFLITSPAVRNPGTSPFRRNSMTESEKPYVQYSELTLTPAIRATLQKDMDFFWDTHISR